MKKPNSSSAISSFTIGIDLGDRKHAVCVLSPMGDILKQESITNSRGSLTALSRRHPRALMLMEVGMQSPWTSREWQPAITSLVESELELAADGLNVRQKYYESASCSSNPIRAHS